MDMVNNHFHTPSFGDEEFAIDSTIEVNPSSHWQGNSSISDTAYVAEDSEITSADETEEKYGSSPVNLNSSTAKKIKDPNEPSKPVSAYAAFFRDTQIAIKGQNPKAEFSEVAKIVSSMWDALDPEHKNVYKKNAEIAKREYVKNLAEYRANLSLLNSISSPTRNQQQQQQQQQQVISTNVKQIPIASKPAVFTISRVSQPQDTTPTTTIARPNLIKSNNQMTSPTQNVNLSEQQPNVNLLAEAGSVQKCIREGCHNRAIVNPDWEDEYCSNECVIKHCQDVFTKWVQSNEMQQQETIST